MRVFLNYDKEEKPYIRACAAVTKKAGVSAIQATSKVFQISELLTAAKDTGSDAILLANTGTLNHCVAGNKPTLDNFRGSRLNFSVPAIVINSLLHIVRVPEGAWLLEQDVKKLQHLNKPVETFSCSIADNPERLLKAYEIIKTSELIVFDVETTPVGQGLITSLAYSALLPDMTWYNVVVPFIDYDGIHYKEDGDFAEALEFMRSVNGLPQPKCAHNATYDGLYSFKYRAPPHNLVLDTMLMWQSWYAGLPKDLSYIASILLYDYYQWKNELAQAKKNKDLVTLWNYNAKDTWYTGRILLLLLKQMPDWAYNNYRRKYYQIFPAMYSSMEGCAVDWERHAELRAQEEKKLIESGKNLRIMAADPNFNPGSPQQVGVFIYDILGAKPPKVRGPGGKWIQKKATGEQVLNKVAMQHPLLAKVTEEILLYRSGRKAIGTYFDFTAICNRVFWQILVGGTETDRYASMQSPFYGGLQLQNIPSEDSKSHMNVKGFMIADDGFTLVELDMNKAEARCVAYLCRCLALIEALEDHDRDFYKILATIFFGFDYEDVTKDLRNNVIKRIIHGTNYVMQEDTFIDTATPKRLYEAADMLDYKVKSLKEFAHYLLEIYHEKFPEVREEYENIKEDIRTTRKLVSPLGHVRYFFGDIDKNKQLFRSAVAHRSQNLSVDIINKGFEKIYRYLVLPSHGDIRLKGQIHDSIFAQVKDALVPYYIKEAHRLTEYPVEVHGRIMNIPRDFKVGKYWDQMEEITIE